MQDVQTGRTGSTTLTTVLALTAAAMLAPSVAGALSVAECTTLWKARQPRITATPQPTQRRTGIFAVSERSAECRHRWSSGRGAAECLAARQHRVWAACASGAADAGSLTPYLSGPQNVWTCACGVREAATVSRPITAVARTSKSWRRTQSRTESRATTIGRDAIARRRSAWSTPARTGCCPCIATGRRKPAWTLGWMRPPRSTVRQAAPPTCGEAAALRVCRIHSRVLGHRRCLRGLDRIVVRRGCHVDEIHGPAILRLATQRVEPLRYRRSGALLQADLDGERRSGVRADLEDPVR